MLSIVILLCLVILLVLSIQNHRSSKMILDNTVVVKMKLIDGGKLPEFKTKGAACMDAYARLREDMVIAPKSRKLVPLGFACGLPEGYELQVRPRSGLTSKSKDIGWGTGDMDYTGEYMACVSNNSDEDFIVHNGDRICQIAIREIPQVTLEVVDSLEETERGSGGFGHTGI